MDERKPAGVLDISLLDRFPATMKLGDSLYLNENLDEKDPETLRSFIASLPSLPAKLRFSCTILCTGGSAKLSVSKHKFIVRKNDVLLVSGGAILHNITLGEDFKAIALSIPSDSSFAIGNHISTKLLRGYMANPQLLSFEEDEAEVLQKLLLFIRHTILSPKNTFKEDAVEGILLTMGSILSSKLAKDKGDMEEIEARKTNILMRRFLNEVSLHYMDERRIGWYADRLCVSPKYFAQVIYKESGKYAKDWIRDYVIRAAKKMLKSGNYTVQEVSDALHFANQSFFGTYFKKAVGLSPKDFIRTYSSGDHGFPQGEPHHPA
ncbi:MAG: AraC family transcriptional regulator [Candidatus Cryptobacteroides sp.]|nr:AraC family transcriptional regulator [Candidatus Cryptobacteroides sp.]